MTLSELLRLESCNMRSGRKATERARKSVQAIHADGSADVRPRGVHAISENGAGRIHETTWVVGISSALTLLLGGVLLWLFFYRVLFPLRGMVADAQLLSRRSPRG